jgi:hypothetical protein
MRSLALLCLGFKQVDSVRDVGRDSHAAVIVLQLESLPQQIE